MTEHAEKPHSLDWHLNEPLSGKGRNEPSRIQDLEVRRGIELGDEGSSAPPAAGAPTPPPEPQLAPDEVTGLEFWLRADTGLYTTDVGSTPAGIGDPVGRWEDKSASALHVTQPTGARRPSKLTTGFKAQPGVAFVQASQHWLRSDTFAKMNAVARCTWLLCVRTSGVGTSPVVSPNNNANGYHDDGGQATFWHHGGNFELGRYVWYRPLIGKVLVLTYDSSGVGNAGKIKMWLNRVARTVDFSISNAVDGAYAVAAGLTVGKDWNAASYLDGEILEAALYLRALTDEERLGLEAYARARYFGLTTGGVHCVGDSLTLGYPDHSADGKDWPTKLGALLGASWTVERIAFVAFTITQIEPSAVSSADPDRSEWLDVANGGLGDVVIHQGGTNNMHPYTNNQPAATAIAEMVTSVAKRHLQGFKVLVVTVPPIGPVTLGGADAATYESRRQTYNAAVRNGTMGADGIVDWAADARLSDPTNATYFYSGDQVHLTEAGNVVAAELAQAAIEAL